MSLSEAPREAIARRHQFFMFVSMTRYFMILTIKLPCQTLKIRYQNLKHMFDQQAVRLRYGSMTFPPTSKSLTFS
jgi:hypothetical protein